MQHPTITVNTAVPRADTKNMLQSTQQKLRILWDESMKNPSRSVRHEKTSVLLISWDPNEDDLKVEGEVARLQTTLKDTYGFKVTSTQLALHHAKKQALADISKFVLQEDEERTLLVIYYAGHGFGGDDTKPGDLVMAPKAPKLGTEVSVQSWKESVVWSKIETAITLVEHADILLIFDCCNAGRLCRPLRSIHPTNHYQVLGACSEDQTTRGPGKESFTSALIWALEKLSSEETPFAIGKLRTKIMQCPDFPEEQIPALSDREARDTLGDLVICRKGLAPSPPRPTPTKSERELSKDRAYMDLRFVFDGEITEEKVKETAEGLKKFRDGEAGQNLKLSRIAFRSKYTAKEHAKLQFQEAIEEVVRKSPTGFTPASGTATLMAQALLEQAQIRQTESQKTKHPRAKSDGSLKIPPRHFQVSDSDISDAETISPMSERTPLLEPRQKIPEIARSRSEDDILVHLSRAGTSLMRKTSSGLAWSMRTVFPCYPTRRKSAASK